LRDFQNFVDSMGSVEVTNDDTFAALERYDVRVGDFKKDVGWVVSIPNLVLSKTACANERR
jgi:hypothetical protein